MMRKTIYTLTLVLQGFMVLGQAVDAASDLAIRALISKDQFFEVRDQLAKKGGLLEEKNRLAYEAWLAYVLNNSGQSNQKIEQLLQKHTKSLSDSTIGQMLRLQAFNYFRIYDYKNASKSSQLLFGQYSHTIDSQEVDSYKNMDLIYEILKEAPAQKVVEMRETKLKTTRDKANLLNIPVSGNDTLPDSFIFDTGANLSTITESYARKFDLTIYEKTIEVGAFGGSTNARLGLCPKLKIGNIVFSNVVFIVFADSVLDFKSFDYKINGIVGFPVMNAMKEIQFSKSGDMIIPEKQTSSEFQNLVLDGLQPVVEVEIKGKRLPFRFDSGANSSDFFPLFYQQMGSSFELLDGQKGIGGAGGVQKVPVKVATKLALTIAGKPFVLSNAVLHTQAVLEQSENAYGNIGQDVIGQYPKLIINLDKMFIGFSED